MSSNNIRSISIMFNYYIPNDEAFISALLNWEKLPSGFIIPDLLDIRIFLANIYLQYSRIFGIDIVRLLIAILLFIYITGNCFITYQYSIENFFTVRIFGSYCHHSLLFIIYIIIFSIKNFSLKSDLEDYITIGETWRDGKNLSSIYWKIYYLESLYLFLIGLNITSIFEIVYKTEFLFLSAMHAAIQYIYYSLFFIGLIIVYTVTNYIVYSPYYKEGNAAISFGKNLIESLYASIGFIDVHQMLEVTTIYSIFHLIIFFLLILIFFHSVFISYYAETLRVQLTLEGYPEDNFGNEWLLKDLMNWIWPNLHKKESTI